MRFSKQILRPARFTAIVAIAATGLTLSGCNGSGGALGPISSFGPSGSKAQIRFVNASPDAGPVQVFIDNTQQFCSSGTTGSGCAVSYGQATAYNVSVGAGSHAIVLRDANGTQINLPGFSGSLSVNSGNHYAVVLAGEEHPASGGASNLALTTITQQPFTGKPQINFNQASTFAQNQNSGGVQFGYYNGTSASANSLGQPVTFGTATNPQSLPSGAQNTPITFYAQSPTSGVTATPSVADATNCSTNSLPCPNTSGHLSLYLIDGPAASSSPTTPPAGISSTAKAAFIGVFDP